MVSPSIDECIELHRPRLVRLLRTTLLFLTQHRGGLAADTTGPANTVYPMTILSGLLCLGAWAVTSSPPVLLSFVSLYGLCSGVFIAVLPAIVAQITPVAKLGGRIGAFYSACAIAQLVGSPIGGALISTRSGGSAGSYLGLILFAVRCAIADAWSYLVDVIVGYHATDWWYRDFH